jgi:hypothetical protein
MATKRELSTENERTVPRPPAPQREHSEHLEPANPTVDPNCVRYPKASTSFRRGICGYNKLTLNVGRSACEHESIKASATRRHAAAIAENWLHEAKFEAIESGAEQWERWREEYGSE